MNDRTRHHYDDRSTDIRIHDGHETARGVYALLDAVEGQSHGIARDRHDDGAVDLDAATDDSSDETLFHEVIA